MNIGISGLYNIPAIIGIFLGSYIGGGFTDLIAERMARRNNGIFEPESRLIPLIIPFLLEPVGLIMFSFHFFVLTSRYGVGVDRVDSWAVGFIGYGFLCFGLATIPAITMTYGMNRHRLC